MTIHKDVVLRIRLLASQRFELGENYAIASSCLASIHGCISARDEGFRGFSLSILSRTQRTGHSQILVHQLCPRECFCAFANSFEQRSCLGQLCVTEHQKKFFSAVTTSAIGCTNLRRQKLSKGSKHLISSFVTVTVIDLLEEVNVKHCDAKRCVSALSCMNTLLQSIHDPSAVGQSRQVIVAHQVFNLLQRDGQFFIARTESILHAAKVGDQDAASDDRSEHDTDSEELPDEGIGGHAHLRPYPINGQRNCNERATPGHPETCTPRSKKAVGTEDQKHNQCLERNLRSCDKQAQHPCNRD